MAAALKASSTCGGRSIMAGGPPSTRIDPPSQSLEELNSAGRGTEARVACEGCCRVLSEALGAGHTQESQSQESEREAYYHWDIEWHV